MSMRQYLLRTTETLVAVGPSSVRSLSSSSSRSSFLFRRPPAPDASQLLQQILRARSEGRLDLVSKLYPAFSRAELAKAAVADKAGARALRGILDFVATTNKVDLLQRIFGDLAHFGVEASADDHLALVRGLVRAGKTAKALRWVQTMSKTYGVSPSLAHWNVVLSGWRQEGDLESMRKTIGLMEDSGIKANEKTYNVRMAMCFDAGLVDSARKIRWEMDAAGIVATQHTISTLLNGFTEARERASAAEVRPLLDEYIFRSDKPDVTALNVTIKHEGFASGPDAAFALAEDYARRGFPADARTISGLIAAGVASIHDSTSGVQLLERAESVADLEANAVAWTMVQEHLIALGNVEEAIHVYREARARSVQVDATMVQVLLKALLEPSPSAAAWETAKALYDDIASTSRAIQGGPDVGVYVTLLRACANPAHPDFDFVQRLSADMRDRHIQAKGPILTWQIVAQMRVASSIREAFEAYDSLRAVNVDALSTSDYNTILAAFTSLSLPSDDNGPAPSLYIKDILADMRKTQNPLDAKTYAILLAFFSRLEEPSLASISQIHHLIKVDSNLDPDAALFNALMNAYSRVRAFDAALRIWDTMGRTGSIDNYSVSIVLDTCAFVDVSSGEGLRRAKSIWADLVAERFHLNAKNRETYVECLCRQGDFAAAEDILSSTPPSSLTTGMIEVFVKLARRDGLKDRADAVLARVEQSAPEVLAGLDDRLRR